MFNDIRAPQILKERYKAKERGGNPRNRVK